MASTTSPTPRVTLGVFNFLREPPGGGAAGDVTLLYDQWVYARQRPPCPHASRWWALVAG